MKVVHLCLSAFYIDGFSYQENILPKYHVRLGCKVTLIASLESFDNRGMHCYLDKGSTYESENGFKVVRLNYKRRGFLVINRILRRYEGFFDQLVIEDPDVIFSHNISFLDITELIRYLRINPRCKLYCDNHSDFINSGRNIFSKYILHYIVWRICAQSILPFIEVCYGVTQGRCDFMQNVYGFPEDKLDLLVMGVDDDLIPDNRSLVRRNIRARLSIKESEFTLITGGKIDERKRVYELLLAIKNIHDIHLILFGVIAPSLHDLIVPLIESNPRVHFVGWLGATDISSHVCASDLGVFPGTHSTLWEQCIGLGLPCVFKSWDGISHLNVNGNCFLLDSNDIDELSALIRACRQEGIHQKLLEKASTASKGFVYSEIAKKSIQL